MRNTSLLICGLLAFALQSCDNKENLATISTEEQLELVDNSNEAETMTDEDILVIDSVVDKSASSGGRVAEYLACAAVSRDEEAKTIIVDFGEGCVGPHGRERSGKVIITYGGVFGDGLANRTITFEDYYVNNRNITGEILVGNFNRNDEGHLTSTRTLKDYTVNYPDGNSLVINGATVREWIAGEGDGLLNTNVFRITGSHEGVSTRGRTFSHTITVPIIADFGCWMSGGFMRTTGVRELVISNADRSRVRTVDYGDGTCDNEVTVTINGNVHTVKS